MPRLFIKNEAESIALLKECSKGSGILNEYVVLTTHSHDRYEGYKIFESLGIVVPEWKLFDNRKDDPAAFAKSLPRDGMSSVVVMMSSMLIQLF